VDFVNELEGAPHIKNILGCPMPELFCDLPKFQTAHDFFYFSSSPAVTISLYISLF
jgi:hypothetical protein